MRDFLRQEKESIMRDGSSIVDLVKELKREAQTFFREEIQLLKAELSEKLARYGINAASLAIGGFVAYAGLIVFLCGLGALLAFAFTSAGLNPQLAWFIGLDIIGLLVIGAGSAMVLKGLTTLKTESPAPQRTIHTLQQFKATAPNATKQLAKERPEKDERTPEQLEASIVATEAQMADTLEALTERTSLDYARRKATAHVRAHPYRWGLVAAGCGAAGSYLLKRKLSR
jgi:Putative Actinobacterial Holin-X, holin superfamily III